MRYLPGRRRLLLLGEQLREELRHGDAHLLVHVMLCALAQLRLVAVELRRRQSNVRVPHAGAYGDEKTGEDRKICSLVICIIDGRIDAPSRTSRRCM